MAKVGLKDTIKELNKRTGAVLSEAERVKRNADIMLQMLRQQESVFLRQEEEERQRIRHEQQQQIMQSQTKAWTMPDEDERAILDAAEAAAAASQEMIQGASAEEPAREPLKEQVEEPIKAPSGETVSEPVKAQTEEPVKEITAEPEKTGETPLMTQSVAKVAAFEKSEEAQSKAKEPMDSRQASEPDTSPAAQEISSAKKTKPEPEKKKDLDAPILAEVETPIPRVRIVKPAPKPEAAKPVSGRFSTGQAPVTQQYGRPAPGAQQYGRPAPGAQQYGRPAPGAQQYGRPAPGAQQYGRPAPGAQQYGRPAPGAQQYGRPAPGAQQFGRAASGSRPGGVGRSQGRAARPTVDELLIPIEKDRVSNYDPNKKNYVRKPDPEHVSKQRKQIARSKSGSFGMEDEVIRGGKRSRTKKPSAQQLMAPIKIETAIMNQETITVKDLTERIGKPAGEILKKLLLLGNIATINSELDYDTASLVCSEFDVELILKLDRTAEDQMIEIADEVDSEEDLEPRPPVITIMGHVDHGKTSLLDYIRDAHVTRGEAGGITQHIGAYTVELNGQIITFLDTPGHEAFTAMRARGAQSTDIAVLVVAADDGVMPQTVEAINHAKAADVPIIVAINKMDKPEANPERIKQDLTNYNMVAEDWGGDTIMVPVSAKTGEGVDNLLEMILLQAEVLQLRANPNRMARGIIIEAKLDKSRGSLATVLLKNGTLRVGDNVIAGMATGRVRALLNDKGENVREAGPSMPVEISGFDSVPSAGDEMIVVNDEKLVRQVAKEREDRMKEQRIAASTVTLDNLFQNIKEGEQLTLNILIKADVQGSAEAVRQSLEKLSNDQVKISVLHSGVGAISKDDVNLAATANATIIGFNIRPDNNAREVAARENIDIRLYRVIYQAIEDVEKAMKGMLAPEFKEVVLGHAEVRNVFKITGSGTIAGCYVTDGKMQRNQPVRLLRDNVVIFEGKLSSLRRFKDDVREVASGYECGIGLENYNDIKENDVIECFMMEEIER
ncbi:MAG: translation initiation factor IF-2 [Bacillota bacterium]|nr:translation initiation factor IF-2 [Bacillota bacterium]